MPNIEIRGYGKKRAKAMRRKIEQLLKGKCDGDETITTICRTKARTINGARAPFLRVVASPTSLGPLVELLKLLEVDIEVQPLGEWAAKKKKG